jgi:hypothetical protein
MITTSCPKCRRQLTYQNEHAGMQGQCDGCGSVFIIPELTTPTTPPPSPQPYGQQSQASASNDPLDSLAALSGGGQQQSGGYQQGSYQGGYQQSGYNPSYQTPYQYQNRYGGGQSHFGMAIAGFILSLVFPLLGLIFSAIALSGMKKSHNKEGYGFALAGLIISIVSFGLACLYSCLVLSVFSRMGL